MTNSINLPQSDAPDSVPCRRLLKLLESIRTGIVRDYPYSRRRTPATEAEYNFLLQREFTQDLSKELSTEALAYERFSILKKELSGLQQDRAEITNPLFVFRRARKLAQLNPRIESAESNVRRAELECEAARAQRRAQYGEIAELSIGQAIIPVVLSVAGKQALRELWGLSKAPEFESRVYPSESYNALCENVIGSRRREFAQFFSSLLDKLNSLSDPAAELISSKCRFWAISYDASDQRQMSYDLPGYIKYTRKFQPPENDAFISVRGRVRVPEGYTGFTFEELQGPRWHESGCGLEFEPEKEIIPANPSDLASILLEHQGRGESPPGYFLSVGHFLKEVKHEDSRNPEEQEIRRAFPEHYA